MTKCECGCGGEASPGKRYIQGHNQKGRHHTKEAKQKISDTHLGSHRTKETKQKMREAHLGKHSTEEAKRKVGDANRGRHPWNYGLTKETDERVMKQSKALAGRTKENDESIRKRAEAQHLLWQDSEYRELHSGKNNYMYNRDSKLHSMYGKHHTPKTKQKMSDSHLGKTKENNDAVRRMAETKRGRTKENSEGHRKQSEKLTGRTKENDESVRNQSEKLKGRTKENDASMRRVSEIKKEQWQDPEYVKMMMKAMQVKPNKPEKLIESLLNQLLPEEYKINIKGEVMILGGKRPDFININGQKKIIEFNGCYHHNCPICFPEGGWNGKTDGIEESEKRAVLFKSLGYDTLFIWGHEMNDMKSVINKILKFHNLPSLSATIQTKID